MSCTGGQYNTAGPEILYQSDLKDLDVNDPPRQYQYGCSLEDSECTLSNYTYSIYPPNYEYTGVLSDSPECTTCSNNYGCDWNQPNNDPSHTCCCEGQSGFAGHKCAVKRIAYNGQHTSCCLQATSGDVNAAFTGNGIGRTLFSWPSVGGIDTYTCDPKYRKFDGGSDCAIDGDIIGGIGSVCSNFNRVESDKIWLPGKPNRSDATGYCSRYVSLIGTPEAAQSVIKDAVAAFSVKEFKLSDFGKSNLKYAKTVKGVLDACDKYGQGKCDIPLSNLCQQNGWTREDIFGFYDKYLELNKKNPKSLTEDESNLKVAYFNIVEACACHLPPSEYAEWQRLGVDEVNAACDPLCMIEGVIRQWSDNKPAACDQNLCILDDISVDIINSPNANISFDTICGNCGGSSGGCRCVFSGINIFQSGSSVANINFQQNCGGNCQMPDPNLVGNFIPIDCSTGLPIGGNPTPSPSSANIWERFKLWISDHIVLVIFLIIAFIILFFAIWWMSKQKQKKRRSPGNDITLNNMFTDFDDYVDYY